MTKPTVLIIESDENARYLYKIALRFQNLRVHPTKSVAEGMEVIEKLKPDLLLIYQVVPDLNKHNIIKELETIIPNKMPIIIATNLRDQAHKEAEKTKILKAFEYLIAGKHSIGDLIKSSRKALEI